MTGTALELDRTKVHTIGAQPTAYGLDLFHKKYFLCLS